MTGARSSGKTVLIAVMMLAFEHFLAQQHEAFLDPLGDTRERFDNEYVKPLYHQRQLPKATPPAVARVIAPLLWAFSMRGRRFCLALTDAAGEDFERLDPRDAQFRYLGHVDLIVSLIDPLKVPSVATILDGLVAFPAEAGNDVAVLQQVLIARRAHCPPQPGSQSLAIVLSKFDVIQHLRDVEAHPWQAIMNRPGSPLQRDPSMASPIDDPVDSDLLQSELSGLLNLLGAGMLLAAANQSGMPWRLFACSALGMPPTADAVNRGGITPYRVIDVLKAVLAMKGVTG
jgi:hypothetical protein